MCCGSNRRAKSGPVVANIKYVDAIYSPEGAKGETSLYSKTKIDPTTKRRLLISEAASPGDIVTVPESDVIASPNLYLSTCGEPFIHKGGSVVDPCAGRQESPRPPSALEAIEDDTAKYGVPLKAASWDEVQDDLLDTFGPLASKTIVSKSGHISSDDVFKMDTDKLTELYGSRVAAIVDKRRK